MANDVARAIVDMATKQRDDEVKANKANFANKIIRNQLHIEVQAVIKEDNMPLDFCRIGTYKFSKVDGQVYNITHVHQDRIDKCMLNLTENPSLVKILAREINLPFINNHSSVFKYVVTIEQPTFQKRKDNKIVLGPYGWELLRLKYGNEESFATMLSDVLELVQSMDV